MADDPQTELAVKLSELRSSTDNLHQVAEYCRTLYANPNLPRDQYRHAANQSRAYALQAVTALAYQMNQVARAFLECTSVQSAMVEEQQTEVDLLSQRITTSHNLVGRRAGMEQAPPSRSPTTRSVTGSGSSPTASNGQRSPQSPHHLHRPHQHVKTRSVADYSYRVPVVASTRLNTNALDHLIALPRRSPRHPSTASQATRPPLLSTQAGAIPVSSSGGGSTSPSSFRVQRLPSVNSSNAPHPQRPSPMARSSVSGPRPAMPVLPRYPASLASPPLQQPASVVSPASTIPASMISVPRQPVVLPPQPPPLPPLPPTNIPEPAANKTSAPKVPVPAPPAAPPAAPPPPPLLTSAPRQVPKSITTGGDATTSAHRAGPTSRERAAAPLKSNTAPERRVSVEDGSIPPPLISPPVISPSIASSSSPKAAKPTSPRRKLSEEVESIRLELDRILDGNPSSLPGKTSMYEVPPVPREPAPEMPVVTLLSPLMTESELMLEEIESTLESLAGSPTSSRPSSPARRSAHDSPPSSPADQQPHRESLKQARMSALVEESLHDLHLATSGFDSSPANELARVRVLFPYEALDSEEMSLEPGDILVVTAWDQGDGWTEGYSESRGTRGIFPSAYVEPAE